MDRAGVLFIGVLGHIAATAITGALALRKGLSTGTGLVTETEHFSRLALLEPAKMVFGGWDIRPGNLHDSVQNVLHASPGICGELFPEIENDLTEFARNIFPGTSMNCGEAVEELAGDGRLCRRDSLGTLVEQIRQDIRIFRERNDLSRVIVVNLASTEPPLGLQSCHTDVSSFEECLKGDKQNLIRGSSLYSYSAIQEGCPYINFTPSNAALVPAIQKLAKEKGVPVMGNDGKTGETLVKSALAPMFQCRNLEILSWEGFNILGNMDGKVLDNPENRRSKIRTKDRILGEILGYAPHSKVHIHHVPSLGDQKTAWDFIHFQGFLGVNMSLQFTWQGYDSILAAPLVLDLVRLADLAQRNGEAGLMPHLACFFKEPLGVQEHRLFSQFQMLLDYADEVGRKPPDGSGYRSTAVHQMVVGK